MKGLAISSRIDMVIERGIFKTNQITFCLCFTFMPKTGMVLTKTGVCFYSKR